MVEHKLTTKRIDSGFYRLTYRGVSFTAETTARRSEGSETDGLWYLEETTDDWDGYWNHFHALWACKDAVRGGMDERLAEQS